MAETNQAPDVWQKFYTHEPDRYEQLVRFEDYQGNLLKTILGIHSLVDARVIEFGAGTGRLTNLLSSRAGYVYAFDRASAMLQAAQVKLAGSERRNWDVSLGENGHIPAADGWADLAIEGWSFLHIKVWQPQAWSADLTRAVGEMDRVVRPGGTICLLETLGTGYTEPFRAPQFDPFYDFLEYALGFQSTWVRTDYCFDPASGVPPVIVEAFGKDIMEAVEVRPEGLVLPECTGLWWRRKDAD